MVATHTALCSSFPPSSFFPTQVEQTTLVRWPCHTVDCAVRTASQTPRELGFWKPYPIVRQWNADPPEKKQVLCGSTNRSYYLSYQIIDLPYKFNSSIIGGSWDNGIRGEMSGENRPTHKTGTRNTIIGLVRIYIGSISNAQGTREYEVTR
jgi:hypothetical protein